MTKHSLGPWAVNPTAAQIDGFVDGRALPVCQLLWPTKERSEEETFANARLIAAAPDLLAALEIALPALESIGNEKGIKVGSVGYGVALDAFLRAKAAIAKAKGHPHA